MIDMSSAGRRVPAALSVVMASVIAISVACAKSAEDDGPAHGQPLAWGSCHAWVDTSVLPTAQCTTVSVPINWNDAANPQAAQAKLAVMRVPASGERIGVLFANPGGPGASAVDFLERFATFFADSELSRRFDVVAFDPHGWAGQYNVNQLTSVDDIDEITGMPRFSNLPVELAKVASG